MDHQGLILAQKQHDFDTKYINILIWTAIFKTSHAPLKYTVAYNVQAKSKFQYIARYNYT